MATFNVFFCINSETIVPVSFEGERSGATIGDVWSFVDGVGVTYCGTVKERTRETPKYTATTIYDDCVDCIRTLTTTAGTPYEECLICCPCESGATVTSLSVQHPTFTNLYGLPVVQGGAVLIGGNGLNS